MVKEVVSTVDPNVKNGDNMDIRNYVKIKVIPGGSITENKYIDGVVFRKNSPHKRLAASTLDNPKILILGCGIEYQRNDNKISSLETLLEQENKYIEILIEKIMSIQPGKDFI